MWRVDFYETRDGKHPVGDFFCILLHAFRKQTEKLPEREIQVARERMADYLARRG